MVEQELEYLRGFGNHHCSEALAGALPKKQNNPQKAPFGLYAEQLSGSAFTARPVENQRSWLYRIKPTVGLGAYEPYPVLRHLLTAPDSHSQSTPEPLRWDPIAYSKTHHDFVDGLQTICLSGSAASQVGSAVHIYTCTKSMKQRSFINSDGDFLLVPEEGVILLTTEFGRLEVAPGEIAVVQRGIRFSIDLSADLSAYLLSREPASDQPTVGEGSAEKTPVKKDSAKRSPWARGYVCENYGRHFELPYRGPIGANGLANERDFLMPKAAFRDVEEDWQLITKFGGSLFSQRTRHCPYDVVGWHGNYVPYKYDLSLFNTINTVSFDHPDPSIFTVLTSPGSQPGVANVDFVIFPPRWMVAENTFRPPYFHRNIMSEYMGLIRGTYDAKPGGGFKPGGGSLHNCMSGHGPETLAFEQASSEVLKPVYQRDTLAFMFESSLVYLPTMYALNSKSLQTDYAKCWDGLPRQFNPNRAEG